VLVPSRIGYKSFIGGCILLFLIFILLIPALVDIGEMTGSLKSGFMMFLMKANYGCMSLFTAKLFVPAMTVLLNKCLDKKMRNGMNSIFFLGVSFFTYFLNW